MSNMCPKGQIGISKDPVDGFVKCGNCCEVSNYIIKKDIIYMLPIRLCYVSITMQEWKYT